MEKTRFNISIEFNLQFCKLIYYCGKPTVDDLTERKTFCKGNNCLWFVYFEPLIFI